MCWCVVAYVAVRERFAMCHTPSLVGAEEITKTETKRNECSKMYRPNLLLNMVFSILNSLFIKHNLNLLSNVQIETDCYSKNYFKNCV